MSYPTFDLGEIPMQQCHHQGQQTQPSKTSNNNHQQPAKQSRPATKNNQQPPQPTTTTIQQWAVAPYIKKLPRSVEWQPDDIKKCRGVWALNFRMSSHLDDQKSRIGPSGIQSHLAARYEELPRSLDTEASACRATWAVVYPELFRSAGLNSRNVDALG